MYKRHRSNILLLMFGIATLVILLIGSLVAVKAETNPEAGLTADKPLETWSLGITVEGPPTYNAIIGRVVSDVGAYRPARATEAATIFPAPATARTVMGANVFLLSRSGTSAGTVTLSLGIYDYAGTLQHAASIADIDLQTAPTGVWIPVNLSSLPDSLAISPGEFLAFSYKASPGGGDLDVRPLFDVSVR